MSTENTPHNPESINPNPAVPTPGEPGQKPQEQPREQPADDTTAGFILNFGKGLGSYAALIAGVWVLETFFPSEKKDGPVIVVAPENTTKIAVFLAVVGVLLAIAYAFGKMGGERAEKKGYPSHFGFLMCFYFGPFGLAFLQGLKPNLSEIRRREQEKSNIVPEKNPGEPAVEASPEAEAGKPAPFKLEYAGRRPNFTAVYILMGMVLALSCFLWMRPEENGGGGINLDSLALDREGWRGFQVGETEASRKQMESIHADSYTTRYYFSPEGRLVELYVVYRRYGRREFNHNPDQCFPSGGWHKVSEDISSFRYAGEERPVTHMLFDGSGVVTGQVDTATGKHRVGMPPATVSYFFASGDKTENVFLKQQLWMALERLIPNKNGWALIRLTSYSQTDAPELQATQERFRQPIPQGFGPGSLAADPAEALEVQKEFMRVYGAEIQRVITTDSAHSRMAQASAP